MSYPILYDQNETDFDHNGLGILSDCVSCEVSETLNGEFELTMEYPVSGIHFEDIGSRSVIKAKPNQIDDYQLFRVYSQKKNMRKNVVIKAEHISYDMTGIPVSPFKATSVITALSGISNHSVTENPFTLWTDKSDSGEFAVTEPISSRNALGDIVALYGGELEFDNFLVKLHSQRGTDRGVLIKYGKNLSNLKQEENCSSVFTGIYPYWASQDGSKIVELNEKIVNSNGSYGFVRIKTVDFSGEIEEEPSKKKLKELAEEYINSNNVGIPSVSMDVSFVALEQSSEYKNMAVLERVSLGDTVTISFPKMNINATARAVRLVYNVILDRVEVVTLGEITNNIADTIAEQKKTLKKTAQKSQLKIAVDVLTKSILGANGGAVRLLDENGDGLPDTLYIADNADPTLAKKVWRFNYEGWGASKSGYAGPFTMGASFDSGILAEFVTAGTLYGMLLKAGAIESESGKVRIDLTSDTEPVFNTGISTNGITVRADETNAGRLFSVDAVKAPNVDRYYADLQLDSANGENLFRVTETFSNDGSVSPVGCYAELANQNKSGKITLETGENDCFAFFRCADSNYMSLQSVKNGSAGLGLFDADGTAVGGVVVKNGVSSLVVSEINGKKIGWKDDGNGNMVLTGE